MAAKKGAAKKTKKKGAKKTKKAKLHHVKVGNGRPVPRSLKKVKHLDSVAFAKSDKADRFADFASSPFLANEGPQRIKIPFKKTIQADPPNQKGYHYDVLDKDGNIVSQPVRASGPPNPPEIVVG